MIETIISLLNAIREGLISLLKPFAVMCFKLVNAVSPVQALVIYILVLVAIGIWVLTLKQEKPSRSDWPGKALVLHDMRFWASVILVLQIGFYIIFG